MLETFEFRPFISHRIIAVLGTFRFKDFLSYLFLITIASTENTQNIFLTHLVSCEWMKTFLEEIKTSKQILR